MIRSPRRQRHDGFSGVGPAGSDEHTPQSPGKRYGYAAGID